jgi:cation transport ATPase
VAPGARPLDGIVESGRSDVTAALTGESQPVLRELGEGVFAAPSTAPRSPCA